MLNKTSIKSLFRITALTMAFLIFAVTGAQSYSLAAGAETTQRDQEAVTSTAENIVPETLTDETSNIAEDTLFDESHRNTEETATDENYHTLDVGDLETMGEDNSPEASMFVLPIVWAGMGIGQLLGWLAGGTAAVVTIVKFGENVARVADFAAELRKSKQKDKPRYYKAKIDKQGMYIFKGLTDEEALKHLKDSSSNDVWTPLETDAKSLALKYAVSIVGVGSIKITEKESHHLTGFNDTRYYLHYHGEKIGIKRSGHIFYDSTGRMGVNPR
ncbi:hypothetical protein [Paenibacillus pabuli]|uniref:hypothetical protein n=1 Tax=Paenibacillus pabuli TaxID=1472 RepID=UPI001FFFF82F|nr:hypothetical protein [Paenibacillus pabuli]UPK46615.1 hypothetical protein KET34_14805 [Paenibacillus pabuli]